MTGKTPSDLHAHLGYWLRTVSNAVSQSFARKLEHEGVTVAEWVLLRVLYDTDGMAPPALAARMGMTKGAISKLVDRLVQKDLVGRGAQAPRGQWLTLKSRARLLVPRLAQLADRNDAEFFAGLSAGERDQLERLLRKIVLDRGLTEMPTD